MNQWHNTKYVTEWFKGTKNKSKSSFIKFFIVEFYPSISKKLLLKAIEYAQSVTTIEKRYTMPVSFYFLIKTIHG